MVVVSGYEHGGVALQAKSDNEIIGGRKVRFFLANERSKASLLEGESAS
jgi:hypothetical protein